MSTLPASLLNAPLTRDGVLIEKRLTEWGWHLAHRGKVRDTYEHPDEPRRILVVASDRLSIFDIVLPVLVPGKGEILTALTHFWLTGPLAEWESHFCQGLDDRYPKERTLLVRKLQMDPYEMIFRHHIGGSVWKEYQERGTASGQELPTDLKKWQKLDEPIFTPSTKATVGHDVNITADRYFGEMGGGGAEKVAMLSALYRRAYAYAKERGILILDTKFEISQDGILADEVLTPDSSRFTTVEAFADAMETGGEPTFYDKQRVRKWGKEASVPFDPWIVDLSSLDPEDKDHLNFVHNQLEVPDEVIEETRSRYHEIFLRLTGMPLDIYQTTKMGIKP